MMRTDTGQPVKLEDYKPADYGLESVKLHFRLHPSETHVTSTLRLRRREGVLPGTPLVLDGDGLTLVSAKLDGRDLSATDYRVGPDEFVLPNPPSSETFELTLVTEVNPQANAALSGLYRSNGNYCTQCEAEGFRRITYFPDRPDVLAVYSVRVEAPKAECPVLLSNGNPGKTGDLDDGWHFAEWHDPWPKPSYLFALVAGDLSALRDRFMTRSGKPVDLAIYVEHGKEARAAYAMDALKRSMKWDEDVFGCEYDLDVFNIVAVSDFNMGAMENKGLNIFNDKYVLADPDTATDTDYANIEAIIAHEYFHNWTGNRITCRDWFQLCLKEGLTVFRDHEFSADMRSRPVKRIAEVKTLKAHQFPEDASPLAHPVRPRSYREINNFYTATVYQKGSEVVRMIRTLLGADDFRKGMDLYLKRHDGDAATIEDFLAAFAEASGKDLSQFALWYHQAGTPHLNVSYDHDKATGEFTISVEQMLAPTPGESRKRLMHIPLEFALIGPNGHELDVSGCVDGDIDGTVLNLRKRRQEFRFSGISERPAVSLLRGFSAPVTLDVVQPREDLFFLARHDSDLFNRWDALSRIVTEALIGAARDIRGGKAFAFQDDIARLLVEIALDETLDAAFRAQALTLPSESDLAREIGQNIEPDSIRAALDAFSAWMAAQSGDRFLEMHDSLSGTGPFVADAESAGRRALRNVLLDLVSAGSNDPSLAEARFREATNMTDRLAALTVLAHRFGDTGPARHALGEFEERYRDDPLILDKWFAVQATVPGHGTLGRVEDLTRHRAYAATNPNRVRALIGAFSSMNPTGFNRPDGKAYRFFADRIIETDAKNPQLAARLLTALRSWRALEESRRQAARGALVRIRESSGLSKDTSEIVERTLA